MGLAAAKINSFIWDVYCDWFIEIAKPRLNSGDAEQADTARRVLVYVLDKALKLLHPFMPLHHRGAVSGSARLCRDHHDPELAQPLTKLTTGPTKRKPLKRSWTTSRPCVPCAPR